MNNDEDRRLDPELAEEPKDNSVELAIKPPEGVKITAREADKAAKEAGMRTLKASKFKGIAGFGQWVEECGAFKIGLGMLAFSAEQLQDGIEHANKLVNEVGDPEVRAELLGISRDLTEQYIDIGKSLLKASEKTPVTVVQAPVAKTPGPPPGMAIQVQPGGSVQINTAPPVKA